jgi:hypothetical protein
LANLIAPLGPARHGADAVELVGGHGADGIKAEGAGMPGCTGPAGVEAANVE